MYIKHPAFVAPDDSAKLWRYFDFPGFLYLIETQSLFFASVALLRQMDIFEGYWSPFDYRTLYPDESEIDALTQAAEISDDFANITFVNCWHVNELESAAMWRYYGEQIAVQTTFGRLTQSFLQDVIYAGFVRYIDYSSEPIHHRDRSSEYALAMTKHRSFEHEKELRVIVPNYPDLSSFKDVSFEQGSELTQYPYWGKGLSITVDVTNLIETIYFSPKMPRWHIDLLSKLLNRYGLSHVPIKPSQLGYFLGP